jgi:hypothetical protein
MIAVRVNMQTKKKRKSIRLKLSPKVGLNAQIRKLLADIERLRSTAELEDDTLDELRRLLEALTARRPQVFYPIVDTDSLPRPPLHYPYMPPPERPASMPSARPIENCRSGF